MLSTALGARGAALSKAPSRGPRGHSSVRWRGQMVRHGQYSVRTWSMGLILATGLGKALAGSGSAEWGEMSE